VSTPIFIDTGYILALTNTADKYHERARVTALSTPPPFITTEAVLIEIGNALSSQRWRQLSIAALNDLRSDPNIAIVPIDTTLLERAIELYTSRPDKEWGLTDCLSFVVMEDYGVGEALTTDRHFEQAGFQIVLADSPARRHPAAD
jgi:uncharacterized protein